MSKTVSVFIGLLLVAGVGYWVYSSRPNYDTTTNTPTGSSYTLAQVATHASRSSCWAAINGSVYDLTSWIPNHPGGEQPILSLCGRDGTAAFTTQHGGDSRVLMVLSGFKIGNLAI